MFGSPLYVIIIFFILGIVIVLTSFFGRTEKVSAYNYVFGFSVIFISAIDFISYYIPGFSIRDDLPKIIGVLILVACIAASIWLASILSSGKALFFHYSRRNRSYRFARRFSKKLNQSFSVICPEYIKGMHDVSERFKEEIYCSLIDKKPYPFNDLQQQLQCSDELVFEVIVNYYLENWFDRRTLLQYQKSHTDKFSVAVIKSAVNLARATENFRQDVFEAFRHKIGYSEYMESSSPRKSSVYVAPHYLIETEDGSLVTVPMDKLDSWAKAQKKKSDLSEENMKK